MKRKFTTSSLVTMGDGGIRRPGYTLTCSECQSSEIIYATNPCGGLPDVMVVKKFAQKGWFVDKKNPRWDQCPDCIAKAKEKKPPVIKQSDPPPPAPSLPEGVEGIMDSIPWRWSKRSTRLGVRARVPILPPSPTKGTPEFVGWMAEYNALHKKLNPGLALEQTRLSGRKKHQKQQGPLVFTPESKTMGDIMKTDTIREPTISAEAPRVMGKEDRRIIFGKLDEVYVDEKTGYDKGWSDERVAKDLGVPRAWVSDVRDEFYGPAKSEYAELFVAKLEAVKERHLGLSSKVVEISAEFDKLTEEVKTLSLMERELRAAFNPSTRQIRAVK